MQSSYSRPCGGYRRLPTDRREVGKCRLFQIPHCNALRLGIRNLITGAFADVAAYVDDEDFVGHVDLTFVHVVEHGFGAFSPYFIVSAVAEQTDGYDDVAFKGQALLCFQILLLELRAAAQGSVFDKAADGIGVSDRVKALEQQVADGQARLDAVTKDSYTKAEVSRMLKEKDNLLQRYKTTADQTLNSMQKEINHLKSENRRLLTSLYDAAKILLIRFTSEAISIFEKVGLPDVLGQRIWDRVKEYEVQREEPRSSKGIKQ